MSAAPSDVAVNLPSDKGKPLLSSAAPAQPSAAAVWAKWVLTLPLKLLGLTILLSIELVLHIITFQWLRAMIHFFSNLGMRSVPKEGGEGDHHRVNPIYANNGNTPVTSPFPEEGVTTIYDLSKRAFELYPETNCMGTRKYIGQKSAKVKEFGETEWLTFAEVGAQANKFGAALKAAGLTASNETTDLNQLTSSSSLAIFENTSREWMIAAQGAFTQSISVTTIYATLGMDAVIDAVKDCKIRALVCNRTTVAAILSKAKEMPTLKHVIYTNDMISPEDLAKAPPSSAGGITVSSFADFVSSGDTKACPPVPPKAETCAVIMFTSGSTGKPKGVVVTHASLLAAVGAAKFALGVRPQNDVYLGYLPLAHILELMAEFSMIGFGCTICYADPKTLTQTGAYPIGALAQYSPTIMAAVPKIWDVIKKGAQAKIALSSPVLQWVVATAFNVRGFALARGFDTPFFNALVFKKFAGLVGGRLRIAVSGGGPLNTEVQLFVRTAFGCPLFQGYGLTETCAALSIQAPTDMRTGIAGVPLASCEAKLESCNEICDKNGNPYLISDRKDVQGNAVIGRGEVLTRGPSVTKGYYMLEKTTAEAWEQSGWFHTGDIGQFMSDGSIRIVDRKKNLVKLKGGEYIAIENMEMSYGNSSFVDAINGGICCYGDGDMDRPVAIMQLNEPIVMAWAAKNGVGGDFAEIKDSPVLYDAVLKDLQNEGKKAGLSNLEKLTAVTFLTTPWTPENGCLTAANKLQRRVVVDTFSREFEAVKAKGIF